MSRRKEDSDKSGENIGVSRRDLMEDLALVVKTSIDKFDRVRAKNSDRQAWGRLIVNAVKAMGDVLKDSEIDDLIARVEKLEASK